MQAVEKINKPIQGNSRKEHANYSESYKDRLYSKNHSTYISADELIESIRDRMQNIINGKKRYMKKSRNLRLKRKTDNGHVLYITLNKKCI